MVDEIFDHRGQAADELDLIQKDVGFPGEIQAEDLQGGFNLFVVGIFEIFPVEWVFKIKKNLVGRFDLAENQVEKRSFARSPHARDDYGFRGIIVGPYLLKDKSRPNHRLLFYNWLNYMSSINLRIGNINQSVKLLEAQLNRRENTGACINLG